MVPILTLAAASDFSLTNAHGVSPQLSSGLATAATSSTARWPEMTDSTSMELMFSPPHTMMSLVMSKIWINVPVRMPDDGQVPCVQCSHPPAGSHVETVAGRRTSPWGHRFGRRRNLPSLSMCNKSSGGSGGAPPVMTRTGSGSRRWRRRRSWPWASGGRCLRRPRHVPAVLQWNMGTVHRYVGTGSSCRRWSRRHRHLKLLQEPAAAAAAAWWSRSTERAASARLSRRQGGETRRRAP